MAPPAAPTAGDLRAPLNDLARQGVPPEEAAAWLAAQVPEGEAGDVDQHSPFAVWTENWPALTLWLRLQTQWRHDWNGRRQGLRYEAAHAAMAMLKTEDTATLFDQLVEMEHAALEALNGV